MQDVGLYNLFVFTLSARDNSFSIHFHATDKPFNVII